MGDCSLFCEGLLSTCGCKFLSPGMTGQVTPSSTLHPPAPWDFQDTQPSSGGWSCLHQTSFYSPPHPCTEPAPSKDIFTRAGLTVGQCNRPLPQKTNTTKSTDQKVPQSISFRSGGNRAILKIFYSFYFIIFSFFFGIRYIVFCSLLGLFVSFPSFLNQAFSFLFFFPSVFFFGAMFIVFCLFTCFFVPYLFLRPGFFFFFLIWCILTNKLNHT